MYPGKVGRDHLGLASVSSDQILPTLSPAINVLTIHPRYHAFYAFLLDEFWQRNLPRGLRDFTRFYRPREFVYSLGAYLCDRPEHGEMRTVVGGQKTGPLAAQKHTTYRTNFPYIKSELGGYGLYYRSVMVELELVLPGVEGQSLPLLPIDVPTNEGKKIAAAFREAVRGTVYYQKYFDTDDVEVPVDVIREYIRKACLCQLQTSAAPDRSLLIDAFMHSGGEKNAEARRSTFRMLLDVASQTQGQVINEDVFRQLVFYRATADGIHYEPRDTVLEIYRRWRMYQAREYYSFALNGLWYYLCDWGVRRGGTATPLPLSQFWEHVSSALDLAGLAGLLQLPAPQLKPDSGFGDLLEWLERTIGSTRSTFDEKCGLESPVNEDKLYRLALKHRADPHIMVAGMVVLLSLLYLRFGSPGRWLQPEWEICRMGSEGRLSLDGFIRTLFRQQDRRGQSLMNITRWVYEDYVILQHRLVATSKLPDNTFRFQREGNALRFYTFDNTLGFSNSRYEALSTTIHELGLCGDLLDPEHLLTKDGQRLLAEGNL